MHDTKKCDKEEVMNMHDTREAKLSDDILDCLLSSFRCAIELINDLGRI